MTPRLLLLAPVCALALAIPGSAPAATSSNGGALVGVALVTAPSGAYAGRVSKLTGTIPGAGRVTIEASFADGPWQPIGSAKIHRNGRIALRWRPPQSGQFDLRAVGAGAAVAGDAAGAGATELGSLTVYKLQRSTWYGPGDYGSRTACGVKLTRRTLGVAHRTLPCGTQVEFFAHGRIVRVPVIDRGPFVHGVRWDLTLAAARKVRMLGSERVGALPIR